MAITLFQQILQYVISGLTVGSTYALIALGFNIIYNSTGVINFAQGEFVMLGGMTAVFLFKSAGLPLYAAAPVAIVAVTFVGVLLDKLAIDMVRRPSIISLIIVTIGASILIRGLAMLAWGKDTLALPSFSSEEPLAFFGAIFMPQAIWIFAAAALVVAALRYFFDRTLAGKAMLACSANRAAASLVGINARRMIMLSFAISAAVGALAGIVLAPITLTSYDVGVMLGLKGFCAAILGGLSSFTGAIVGGLLLGVLENLGAGLLSSAYKDAVAFFIMLLVLFLRPSGLLGKRESRKV